MVPAAALALSWVSAMFEDGLNMSLVWLRNKFKTTNGSLVNSIAASVDLNNISYP